VHRPIENPFKHTDQSFAVFPFRRSVHNSCLAVHSVIMSSGIRRLCRVWSRWQALTNAHHITGY